MTRYLSGLCVAGLGLCGGGWLIVTALAFGGGATGGDLTGSAGRVNLATGAGLILVSCAAAAAWAVAWRRRMRVDGVLAERFMVSRREARQNRRDLARDVRRTARLSKRSARDARREARRSARLADGGVPDDGAFRGTDVGSTGANAATYQGNAPDGSGYDENGRNGNSHSGHGSSGYALNGPAYDGAGYDGAAYDGARRGSAWLNGAEPYGSGHNGASTAEVLGELRTLRTLLGPLLTAAEPKPAPVPQQAQQAQAQQAQAQAQQAQSCSAGPEHERPRQAAGLLAGNDELLRIADSEEAWW